MRKESESIIWEKRKMWSLRDSPSFSRMAYSSCTGGGSSRATLTASRHITTLSIFIFLLFFELKEGR